MKTVTSEDIADLGLYDPTVHACLTAQRVQKGISREDMLMAMVWYLVEDKRALSVSLYDCHANRSPQGTSTDRGRMIEMRVTGAGDAK